MMKTPKALAAAITRNAQQYHDGRIDHATFSARNVALWREIDRGQLAVTGSLAAKRIARVLRYLRKGKES